MGRSKKWLFLFISLWFFMMTAIDAQEVQRRVMASSQAWIHGLPAFMIPGGKPIEAVNFRSPIAPSRRLNLVFVNEDSVVQELKSHLSSRRSFATLAVVVRKDPITKEDIELRMTNVTVASVNPMGMGLVKGADGMTARQVTLVGAGFNFDKITEKIKTSANPGPPPGAPPVRKEGINKGWIYLFSEDPQQAAAVDVLGFSLSDNQARVKVFFRPDEYLWKALRELKKTHRVGEPLILVLPDKETQRYVELKLFAPVSALIQSRNAYQDHKDKFDVLEVVFGSNWIEYRIEDN
jgi:hypothetical protein